MKTYNESQITDVVWSVLNCTDDEKHETIKLLIDRISKLKPCSDENQKSKEHLMRCHLRAYVHH